jgi:hypothetical protein
LSRAIVTNISDAANNNYTILVPKLGEVSGQCVTLDEITVGMEVRIADIDNQDPSKTKQFGKFRFLPNSHPDQATTPEYVYQNGGVWKSSTELWNTNNRSSFAKAYILSSERNKKWQKEYPLYKRGKVTEIIDEKYMYVDILGDMIRKCRTDYMTCDAQAFEVDDSVVIFYENGDFFRPVVVGFWDDATLCVSPAIAITSMYVPTTQMYVTDIEFSVDDITWVSYIGPTNWTIEGPDRGWVWDGSQYYNLDVQGQANFLVLRLLPAKLNDLLPTSYVRITFTDTNPPPPPSYQWFQMTSSDFIIGEFIVSDINYLSGESKNFDWYTPVA